MAERKLFGTDGVRGKSNVFPMTAEVALKLGIAAGSLFKPEKVGNDRHQVIIGKDTRLSCYMIENALAAGFTSMGIDVVFVGPLPTPAVAFLTRSMRVDLGVMISASHNPYQDNGIKIFGPDGFKLSDDIEAKIEELMSGDLEKLLVPADDIGRMSRLESARGRYIEYVKSSFPKHLSLEGKKIVIDCANGAAYKVAPAILWELGAEIVKLGVEPNGRNINAGVGALHIEEMQKKVVEVGADIGIALDGDADRVIICDENGKVVDGDQIIARIALEWQQAGILKGGVITTVMSNLGLEKFLAANGIKVERSPVGDRYVSEMMKTSGFNLGGEQSGHVILGKHATTGDGMMAALQVLAALVLEGKKASEALHVFEPFPQVLENVRFESREKARAALDLPEVKEGVRLAEETLGSQGRILIRTSGTEPLIRIMAEGSDEALIRGVVKNISSLFEKSK